MKKRMFIMMAVAVLLALPLSSALAVFNIPTETLMWDPDRAYNGYTAYCDGNFGWLIDMEGRVVNKWEGVDAAPNGYMFLLENGRWRTAPSPSYAPRGVLQSGGARGRIEEYTWEGDRVFWWDAFDGTPVPGDPTAPYTDGTFRFHHDWQRMYNDDPAVDTWTYLILIWVAKNERDADNIGVDPALDSRSRDDTDPGYDDTQATWSPCGLIEFLPDYASGQGGEIIWYWTFADHMVTTDPGSRAATASWVDFSGRISMPPVVVADIDELSTYPQKLNVNNIHYTEFDGPRTDYQHCNSIDYDETTGHIAINAKACNEFFVIDHDGTFVPGATPGTAANGWNTNEVGADARTSAGDFLYRFGMPANYSTDDDTDPNYKEWPSWQDEKDAEMYGTHDIQFIEPYHWRPPWGAGDTWAAPTMANALRGGAALNANGRNNFLMFDNGCYNPVNRVSKLLEVNPYIYDRDAYDDSGSVSANYVDPITLGRRDQVVWSFNGVEEEFYSLHISSVMRLPNGNTFSDAGRKGHFIEVTEDGDLVWEYVNPIFSDGIRPYKHQGDDNSNGVFRAYRFGPDHPGFKGVTLKPGFTMTGRVPGTIDVYEPGPAGPISGRKVGAGGGGGGAAAGTGGGGY